MCVCYVVSDGFCFYTAVGSWAQTCQTAQKCDFVCDCTEDCCDEKDCGKFKNVFKYGRPCSKLNVLLVIVM